MELRFLVTTAYGAVLTWSAWRNTGTFPLPIEPAGLSLAAGLGLIVTSLWALRSPIGRRVTTGLALAVVTVTLLRIIVGISQATLDGAILMWASLGGFVLWTQLALQGNSPPSEATPRRH